MMFKIFKWNSETWARLLPVAILFLCVTDVWARVGGGQGYGGGGGGGDSDGGAIVWLLFQLIRFLIYLTIEYPLIGIPLDIIVIGGVIYYFARVRRSKSQSFTAGSETITLGLDAQTQSNVSSDFAHLRRFDPNFSEIVFTDFCYALYGRAHQARAGGTKALSDLSPYLSDQARNSLMQLNPPALKEVTGVIIGSMNISNVAGLQTEVVTVLLEFESNYTELVAAGDKTTEMAYYAQERWQLERKKNVLSPPPAQATALHCPRCGAPLQKNSTGGCAFCGVKIEGGDFQWYVRSIATLSRNERGPLLTTGAPEVGTDFPSVVQSGFAAHKAAFERAHPNFSWGKFQTRARLIFDELQAAWSTLQWERARPHETDNLFHMHQYWIDAYKRQGLRNPLDQVAITAMQPVKISEDAFYNSITLRIGAQGYDYTVDAKGKVVSGSKTSLRRWTEYWTFIRNRQPKTEGSGTELNCPNCGAPLKVNNAGVCDFCGGKITSGEFDWILSKIEQDESYRG